MTRDLSLPSSNQRLSCAIALGIPARWSADDQALQHHALHDGAGQFAHAGRLLAGRVVAADGAAQHEAGET